MPTLLDTAEFALAKATLNETLQRIEKARQDRLESVRKYLEMSETDLARVKQQALELPAAIANYRAEIARLEATTGADILREAMSALRAECWGPPGEVVEVRCPKPRELLAWYCAACRLEVESAEMYGNCPTCKARLEASPCVPASSPKPQTDELPRPIPGCKHIAEDGTCGHPNALTPECHLGVVCAAKAEKKPAEEPFIPGLPPEALRKVWPEWEDEDGDVVTFKDDQYRWAHRHPHTPSKRVHDVPWSHIKLRPHGATRAHVEALAQEAELAPPPLLDLRTVKVGTKCKADAALTADGKPAGVEGGELFTITQADGFLAAEIEDRVCFIDPLQPAHVVKHACPRCDEGMQASERTALATGLEGAVPPPSEWCDGSGKGGAE